MSDPTPPAGHPGETREQYLARINATKLGDTSKSGSASKTSNQNAGIGCAVVIVIAIIIAIAAALGGGSDSDSSGGGGGSVTGDGGQEVSLDRAGAADVCEQFVSDRLKAPDTATFRDPYGDQISYTGDGAGPITVQASVDSENSFGAKLRSTYTCTVSKAGGDSWTLDDLQLDDGGG